MKIDTNDPVWRKLEGWVIDEVNSLRRENDDPALDDVETAHLRGQIAFAKRLLELGEEPEKLNTPNTEYL